MRLSTAVLALVLAAGVSFAQRHKVNINTETPEGQLLQQIGQESDEAKKTALLEQFVAKYPKHDSIGWVYAQLQPAYLKAGQFDKALDTGEKLLAMDPDDLETAHQNLKAAEAKKDPDLVRKWSNQTSQIAQKVAASAKPKEEDEVEDWKKRVDFAKQVNTYTEYSLYATALQTPDPRKKIELIEALQQRAPQSEYLAKSQPALFLAYRQAGDNDKAVAVAEKVLATDQSNEDMLLVVADSYLQKKREPDRVLAYSAKMIEVMNGKPKPEGVSDADWEGRKKLILGLGHWMTGKLYFGQNKYSLADKSLRQALPFVDSNTELKADTLFHLALANYKMEKIQDAVDFNKACAAIKSRYQAQAAKNLAAIRSQYRGVK
jgi:tetratricopeptide (TPR) repeat protein